MIDSLVVPCYAEHFVLLLLDDYEQNLIGVNDSMTTIKRGKFENVQITKYQYGG
jgi:hypothetical protein